MKNHEKVQVLLEQARSHIASAIECLRDTGLENVDTEIRDLEEIQLNRL